MNVVALNQDLLQAYKDSLKELSTKELVGLLYPDDATLFEIQVDKYPDTDIPRYSVVLSTLTGYRATVSSVSKREAIEDHLMLIWMSDYNKNYGG